MGIFPLTAGHRDSTAKVSLERSEALVYELTCSLVFPGRPLDPLSLPILLVTCQSLYNVFSVSPRETAAETGEPHIASHPCLVAALNTYSAQMAWLSGDFGPGGCSPTPWGKHLPVLSSYLLLALGTHIPPGACHSSSRGGTLPTPVPISVQMRTSQILPSSLCQEDSGHLGLPLFGAGLKECQQRVASFTCLLSQGML